MIQCRVHYYYNGVLSYCYKHYRFKPDHHQIKHKYCCRLVDMNNIALRFTTLALWGLMLMLTLAHHFWADSPYIYQVLGYVFFCICDKEILLCLIEKMSFEWLMWTTQQNIIYKAVCCMTKSQLIRNLTLSHWEDVVWMVDVDNPTKHHL